VIGSDASLVSAAPFILVGVALLGFVVYCWVDLARSNAVRYLPKWVWAIVCLHLLGGILYLFLGRDRRPPN
jgi:Phospholipase_D-nuclease N-terminal